MPTTQNLSITYNSAVAIAIPDVAALATDRLICRFYESSIPINFSVTEVNVNGDYLSRNAGVGYTLNISKESTYKLPSANVTYKLFKYDANGDPQELFNGTVAISGTGKTYPSTSPTALKEISVAAGESKSAGIFDIFVEKDAAYRYDRNEDKYVRLADWAPEEHIGVMGTLGAGVGICKKPPVGTIELAGTRDRYSPNYGNYIHVATGSIKVYIPKHYVKITADNQYYVASIYDFADEAAANAAGYFLPRCFVDGGVIIDGYFRDKYPLNGIESGVAVSKKSLIPLTSSRAVAGYGFSDCIGNSQTPTNTLGGALAVAKSRGNNYFASTVFHDFDLFCLTMAHKQALTALDTSMAAWNGVAPYFPKGNNDNALKDVNDTGVVFTTAGNVDYSQRSLTGSGVPFNKTTHNGQACGITDVNGNMNKVSWGLTSDGTNLYVLKESKTFKDMVDGTSGATHAFDVANYDSIGPNPSSFSQIGGTAGWIYLGNGSNQVFSGETDRAEVNYKLANAGLPLAGGHDASGTTAFGNDGIYVPTAFPSAMCPVSGGNWSYTTGAGVGYRVLNNSRTNSNFNVGVGACLSHVNA